MTLIFLIVVTLIKGQVSVDMRPFPSLEECKAVATEMVKTVPKGPAIGCVLVKEPAIQS